MIQRFGKHSRASSASSSASGGWGRDHIHSEAEGISNGAPSHDGSPSDVSESFTKLSLGSSDPGVNINVKVTGPEDGEIEEKGNVEGSSSADDSLTAASQAALKDEADGDTSLKVEASSQAGLSSGQLAESEVKRAESVPNKDSLVTGVGTPRSQTPGSEESELRMPGTFYLSNVEKERSQWTGSPKKWSETFRKLGLFS